MVDLTNFAASVKAQQRPVDNLIGEDDNVSYPDDGKNEVIVGDHVVKRRGSVSAEQLGKTAFNPSDPNQLASQIKAGEVDQSQKEFLKHTEMIPRNDDDPRELGSKAHNEAMKHGFMNYLRIVAEYEKTHKG